MSALFIVVRSQGPAWDAALPMERQADWAAHAAFMNGLAADGVVLLGGPVDGTDDIVLIVRAGGVDEVRRRLSGDPWGAAMLATTRIARWTLRLGELA